MGDPAFRSRHMSANASSGMSGWRTRLCGCPIISSRVKPLTLAKASLASTMTPFESVRE